MTIDFNYVKNIKMHENEKEKNPPNSKVEEGEG